MPKKVIAAGPTSGAQEDHLPFLDNFPTNNYLFSSTQYLPHLLTLSGAMPLQLYQEIEAMHIPEPAMINFTPSLLPTTFVRECIWTLANLIYPVTELPRHARYTSMRTLLAECMQRLSPTLSTTTSDLILYIPEQYWQTIETKLYLVPKADICSSITHLLIDTVV
jgi:hypothetical protein